MKRRLNRRDIIKTAAALAGGSVFASMSGCEKQPESAVASSNASSASAKPRSDEEYVWISANANLPLFMAADHPALFQIGEELGVKVNIAGPNSIDIPGLVAAVEQTVARRPAGIMVVGWDPSALVAPINKAVESGVPVICVDADVPASKRLAFVGTNWFDIGIEQAKAMIQALNGRKGKIALLGLIEQNIDQEAFAGFRSIAEKAGLEVMQPQQDRGNQAEATRVAAAIIQGIPDLIGMAGFDSESGPGIGQAIKEAGKMGKIIGTTVEAEGQVLRFIKEGILAAAIKQKRKLFTYQGVKALHDVVHTRLKFTSNDQRAGITPIPINYSTGTFTITSRNVDMFLNA
jgi:ribose transport system substrate-binding protein